MFGCHFTNGESKNMNVTGILYLGFLNLFLKSKHKVQSPIISVLLSPYITHFNMQVSTASPHLIHDVYITIILMCNPFTSDSTLLFLCFSNLNCPHESNVTTDFPTIQVRGRLSVWRRRDMTNTFHIRGHACFDYSTSTSSHAIYRTEFSYCFSHKLRLFYVRFTGGNFPGKCPQQVRQNLWSVCVCALNLTT